MYDTSILSTAASVVCLSLTAVGIHFQKLPENSLVVTVNVLIATSLGILDMDMDIHSWAALEFLVLLFPNDFRHVMFAHEVCR